MRRRVLGQRGGIVIFHNALLSFSTLVASGIFLCKEGANSSKKILTSKIKQKKNGKGQLQSQFIKFMKLRSDYLTSISLSFSLVFLQLLHASKKVGVQLHLYSLSRKMFAAKKGRGGHPPGPS